MTQSKRPGKTKKNTPSVNGTKARTKKLTAEFGPKPNFMNWKTYHYLAFHDPEKLRRIVSQSAELKVGRSRQAINREWPLGQKPDHISKASYHSQARRAPWELQDLIVRTYSGPAALAPEQWVFEPSRKLTEEERRMVANSYGVLLSRPDGMDIYLRRLEGIEPSLVGRPAMSRDQYRAGTKAYREMDKSRARTLSGESFASQKVSDYRRKRPGHRGVIS